MDLIMQDFESQIGSFMDCYIIWQYDVTKHSINPHLSVTNKYSLHCVKILEAIDCPYSKQFGDDKTRQIKFWYNKEIEVSKRIHDILKTFRNSQYHILMDDGILMMKKMKMI